MSSCEKGHDHDGACCTQSPTNPSVCQSLEDMDFERSIWQAAIDNDVQKIMKFSNEDHFNVNSADNYGYTALHYAARNGNLDAVKCLIKLGANINLQTGSLKATALHRAVTANKIEMVKFLMELGSDLKIRDSDGLTPMDRAVKENKDAIIQILKPYSYQKSY